jgi:hypothetical protein
MERAASMAKTALIGMAAALGPAALADMISTTVAATAALDNMAARTGMSVESLSALRSIANIVGADFEQIGQGATKLAKAMYEASTNGGKTAEAFNLLGIEIKNVDGTLRATDAVLLEVAKSFAAMEDGATKTALAQILLGKSGSQLIEVLNELGAVGEYQVKVTTQQAAQAEELERDWQRLNAVGRELRTTIVLEMIPAMDALLQTWLDFITQTDGLRSAIKQLASDGTLKSYFDGVGERLAMLMDAFTYFKDWYSAFATSLTGVLRIMRGGFDEVNGAILIATGQVKAGLTQMLSGAQAVKDGWNSTKAAWADLEWSDKFQVAYKINLGLIENTTKAIRDQAPAVGDVTAKNKAWTDALKEWNAQGAAMQAALDSWNKLEAAERIKEAAAATKEWAEQADAMQKALDSWSKITAKAVENAKAFSVALKELVAASDREVATFGLSAEALRDLNTVRELVNKTRAITNELRAKGLEQSALEVEAEAAVAKEAVLANNARLDGLRSWQALLTDVTSVASDFIVDFVNNGSDAF